MMTEVVEMLRRVIPCAVLLPASVQDLRTRTISILPLLAAGSLGAAASLLSLWQGAENLSFSDGLHWGMELLLAMLPGFILLIAARLSKEKIGLGDAWAVWMLGCWCGLWETCLIFLEALALAALAGCLEWIRHRGKNREIPFIPFLLLVLVLNRIGESV